MQNVQVYHVGSGNPMTIGDADFHTEGDGNLVVNRGPEVVAHFPAGKWSAAIKLDAPAQETR